MHTLVWFRNDLRVADNPALYHSCQRGTVTACYIHPPDQWKKIGYSPSKNSFIIGSLQVLEKTLSKLGIPLQILETENYQDVPESLIRLALSHQCQTISFNRRILPEDCSQDKLVQQAARSRGVNTAAYDTATLVPPGKILNSSGMPYQIFTPYYRKWLEYVDALTNRPLPIPLKQKSSPGLSKSVDANDLQMSRITIPWSTGEISAQQQLSDFVCRSKDYGSEKDIPSQNATSLLSAHLSVGTISARQCLQQTISSPWSMDSWVRQLAWRDFYAHLLLNNPQLSRGLPFKPSTDHIPWRDDNEQFDRWCSGQTGFPFVDAGMRQLNSTGFMHNRLRMVTAQFLAKNLLIDWRRGERYFMSRLIDGDFPNNNGGWQWSASTGTDAVPYFRVMNPFLQSKRFDPDARFIRLFIPELRKFKVADIHNGLPANRLYPKPLIDLVKSRQRVLDAFKRLR